MPGLTPKVILSLAIDYHEIYIPQDAVLQKLFIRAQWATSTHLLHVSSAELGILVFGLFVRRLLLVVVVVTLLVLLYKMHMIFATALAKEVKSSSDDQPWKPSTKDVRG